MEKNLTVKGARVHNLKNVNVEIPRDKLVVLQVFQARVNLLSRLIQYMRRVKDAIWKVFPPTQGSF